MTRAPTLDAHRLLHFPSPPQLLQTRVPTSSISLSLPSPLASKARDHGWARVVVSESSWERGGVMGVSIGWD